MAPTTALASTVAAMLDDFDIYDLETLVAVLEWPSTAADMARRLCGGEFVAKLCALTCNIASVGAAGFANRFIVSSTISTGRHKKNFLPCALVSG